jgi:uncharacterized coiled-coil DUF342 family protein
MTLPTPRRSLLSLAVCSSIVLGSFACKDMESDASKADRNVDAQVKKGIEARRVPTTQSLTAALTELSKAAGESNASLTAKIRAKSLQAQTEYEIGARVAADVTKLAPQMNRLLWEISQAATTIDAFNWSAKADATREPKPSLQAIAEKRTAMAAVADAANTKVSTLQGEVDKVKGQIAAMQKQKDDLIASADADTEAARKVKGKEASDLLDKADESRRKAGNLGHDIDKLTASLFPLERDLAAEQATKANADAAIAALDNEKKSVEGSWQSVQTTGQEQKALMQKVYDGLTARAAELDALNKQAATLRAQAAKQLEESAKHYAAAANDAKTLAQEITRWKKPDGGYDKAVEVAAWNRLGTVYHSNMFKLLEAEAEHALAELHSQHAAQAAASTKVATMIAGPLQAATLTVPATLNADADAKAATDAAGKLFTSAAEKFLAVYEGGGAPKDVSQAAKISRMFSLYGQYLNGDQTKLQPAKDEFKNAFGDDMTNPIVRLLPNDLKA